MREWRAKSCQHPCRHGPVFQGKVDNNMANSHLHLGVGARLARAGAIAATMLLGVTVFLAVASAQTPPKKTPDKAAAAPASTPQSAWVKLCEKATAVSKDKDGKEEKKDLNICLTHHERLDGNSGMVLVSAAIRQVEGQDKPGFMVMVPLGMMLQPGMRATVFPKDMWAKVQKNEKIEKADEAKMKGLQLKYTLCHAAGCTAETEATPELIADLKNSGGLMVFAIGASGGPIAFPVPLDGFSQALAGQPVDTAKYSEARKALMQQIAARQQELMQEYKKQNEDLQKMQGGVAPPKAAPAPAPGKK
jgi:invasion protein IalB